MLNKMTTNFLHFFKLIQLFINSKRASRSLLSVLKTCQFGCVFGCLKGPCKKGASYGGNYSIFLHSKVPNFGRKIMHQKIYMMSVRTFSPTKYLYRPPCWASKGPSKSKGNSILKTSDNHLKLL